MVFKVTNSLTNSTKTEQNQDSLIRYLEEEHNRASNLNYTANIHISNIDKKNQIISEISCELPFPSKQEIALFVSDFVSSSGDNQKSKKINLPFFKGSTPSADPVAPTETPKPTEPTPTVDPVVPTETPKPADATPTPNPVAPTETPKPTEPTPTVDPVVPAETPTPADATPKKTGTYKAPATQPKNTKTESTETPKSAEYTSDELPSTGAQSTLPLSILGALGLLSSLPVLKKKNN